MSFELCALGTVIRGTVGQADTSWEGDGCDTGKLPHNQWLTQNLETLINKHGWGFTEWGVKFGWVINKNDYVDKWNGVDPGPRKHPDPNDTRDPRLKGGPFTEGKKRKRAD